MTARRLFFYVGPADLLRLVHLGGGGAAVSSSAEFADWVSAQSAEELVEPYTFVVDAAGVLRLAPRRSEHVVCAEGAAVLGAGEITFRREADRWAVTEVSNQSTGYCPDVACWPAVAAALDRAGLAHFGGFTSPTTPQSAGSHAAPGLVDRRLATSCGRR